MLVIEWDGDDLWNLLSLPNPELYRLYEQFYKGNKKERRETLRRVANTKRNYYRTGKIVVPERSEPYDPNLEPSRIEGRRSRLAKNLAGKALDVTVITIPVEHLSYHEQLQEALDKEGNLSSARFSEWQSLTKNSEGEAEIHDLRGRKFELDFNSEPKWLPVNRVESVRLARREKAKNPKGVERAFIFSDIQIPHQDESALEVAMAVLAEVKPDRVVFIGDLLDLSAWSKYEQQPEWATATQGAINQAHQLMATIRKMLPSAQIQVIEANHEARMPKNLLRNAQAAYGLKRADKPESWPVMSVPYLTAMDTLDVEWVPGYPANRVYLSPELQIIHGTTSGRGNAGRTGRAQKTSTIFGHDHRLSMDVETINSYEGGEQIYAYGVGCLCRIDGHVPSVKRGVDLSGRPVRNLENWSQGFLIANYIPDGGPFHVEQIAINTLHDYQTMFRGKIYEPRPSKTA